MSAHSLPRNRDWCFTIANPSVENPCDNPEDWPGVKYLVYQLEAGAGGLIHWQGYVSFLMPKRATAVKLIHPTAHWEIRKGSPEQARAYVMKSESRIDGPYEIGDLRCVGPGKRSDVVAFKDAIKSGGTDSDLFDEFPGCSMRYGRCIGRVRAIFGVELKRTWKMNVIVYWGVPNSGKSHQAITQYPGAYMLPRPNVKGGAVWWEGYEGQEVVIINEFYGWIPYAEFLSLLDEYPHVVAVKCDSRQFLSRTIVITSNAAPDKWYSSLYASGKASYESLETRLSLVREFKVPLLAGRTGPIYQEDYGGIVTEVTPGTYAMFGAANVLRVGFNDSVIARGSQ